MGGKYSVTARNEEDYAWSYDLYTDSLIKFVLASIKCFIKYDTVMVGKIGKKRRNSKCGFDHRKESNL